MFHRIQYLTFYIDKILSNFTDSTYLECALGYQPLLSQKHHPLFLPKTLLNLQTVQPLFFRQSPYMLVFRNWIFL